MSVSYTSYKDSCHTKTLGAAPFLAAAMTATILCCHASADYSGLNAVVTENIEIDGVMYQSVDLYVGLTDPGDRIWAVMSEETAPLVLSAPDGGFYQSPLGGSTPHNTTFDELFGDSVLYDSFVTIGADTDSPCCTLLLGFDTDAFDHSDELYITEGLWAVLPDNPMAGLGAGDGSGVLIGRFTFRSDQTMSGSLNFMGILADGTAWSASHVTFSYGADAQQRPDLIGQHEGERYGNSIAILGDIDGDDFDDFAVGAPFYSSMNENAGAVYIYSGQSGALIRLIDGTQSNCRFGWAVANAGDVDGDDVPDLMVGAPRTDYLHENVGRVDFISGADGHIISSLFGEDDGDRFGTSVAGPIPGVINPDHPLLVGAPHHDTGGRQAGRIYVLDRSTDPVATLDGAAKGDRLGMAVSFIGDINGDTISDFVVGSPRNDERGKNSGRVDLIDGSSYETLQTLYGEKIGARFGASLAGHGYLDDDDAADFIVGATHFDRNIATKAGRIYAYSGKYGTELWHKTGNTTNERLGSFIGMTADLDCDNYTDVLLGTPRYSTDGLQKTGRLVIRSGHSGTMISSQDGTQPGSHFGASSCVLHDADNLVLTGANRFTIDGLADVGCVLELTLNECGESFQALQQYGDVQISSTEATTFSGASLSSNMQYYLGDILTLPIDPPTEELRSSD